MWVLVNISVYLQIIQITKIQSKGAWLYMNNMEEITGIGISDFRNLRERKNYFVDKTMFIKDIIDDQSAVTLITRPRRFWKTLNMSMLKYYFDCSIKDTAKLVEGLKIMEQGEKYTSKQGEYI